MLLEAFWMQDEGMGSERVDVVCRALPKTIPSYLGSFTFCRRLVMPEAPLSIIARASGRQYLVYRSLYRGFPQPHIRTCHRSTFQQLTTTWTTHLKFPYVASTTGWTTMTTQRQCQSWRPWQRPPQIVSIGNFFFRFYFFIRYVWGTVYLLIFNHPAHFTGRTFLFLFYR